MKKKFFISLCVIVLGTSGHVHYLCSLLYFQDVLNKQGTLITDEQLLSLKKGVTTKQEVTNAFWGPQDIKRMGIGLFLLTNTKRSNILEKILRGGKI